MPTKLTQNSWVTNQFTLETKVTNSVDVQKSISDDLLNYSHSTKQ
jgi:hypothetical protein